MHPTDQVPGSILIVDDTPENLRVLKQILSEQGYKIHPALNGEIALKFVRTNLPDLILLDIMMPNLDGFEVCRKLKADARSRAIPVIFISALDETGDKVKAFSMGGVDYISKPFQEEEVLARVKTHLKIKYYQNHLEDLVRQRTMALGSAKTAAQAASMAKSQFLMNISHELRTPLNGIITAIELALTYKVDPGLSEIHQVIKSSGHNLLASVEHILEFTKATDGKNTVTEAPFVLEQVLQQLPKTHFHKGDSQVLEIDFNPAPDNLPNALIGDAEKLKEVLNCLLSNAAKFSRHDKRVTIGIEVLSQSDVACTFKFSVKDRGIGIHPHELDRIFEPFMQIDSSTTRQYDGMGMGLALCKELTGLMNGRIGVQSEVGKGSTFWFTAEFRRQKHELPFSIAPLSNHPSRSHAESTHPEATPVADMDSADLQELITALKANDPISINRLVQDFSRTWAGNPDIRVIMDNINAYDYDEAINNLEKFTGNG